VSGTFVADEIFRFGPYVLDVKRGTLTNRGEAVFLRPTPFAVLVHLARNIDRVVPKSELFDAVWPDVHVTEDSLVQSIREIRRGLGDSEQDRLRTVSRRGYLLTAHGEPGVEASKRPIVAVLRFRNEGGDEARATIVDGFADDTISNLARFNSVTVLARNSTFQFASHEPNSRMDAVTRVGADFLVEGSVRWSERDALVSVSLIDAKTQALIWGDRYEAHDIELFAVQREIGQQIVSRLASRLDGESVRRALEKPPNSLDAYELVNRAAAILRGHEFVEPQKALPLLELAVAKDPAYAAAHANLALCRFMIDRYTTSSNDELEQALAIATHAAVLSPELAAAPRVMSMIRLFLRQHTVAEHDLQRALFLNSGEADSLEQMGYLLTMRGRPVEALGWMDRAIKLNPVFPPWYQFNRALALYALGDYAAAAQALLLPPTRHVWHHARLAACYAQLGNKDESARYITKIFSARAEFPFAELVPVLMPYEHRADADHLVEGYLLALEYAGR
jgi:TolB-like protein/tetratricopeptide (TPR) repeat protein